jgi:hypothetical protein
VSLTRKLDAVNREFAAIEAYNTAKTGKNARQAPAGRQPRARRGSRREALLELIRQSDGLSRGEILERMGLRGDKSAEMSSCCMDRRYGPIEPYPCSGLCGADILGASEVQHSVQHVGGDGHLSRLSPVGLEA